MRERQREKECLFRLFIAHSHWDVRQQPAIPVKYTLMSTYYNHRIVEKRAHLTSWFLYTRVVAAVAAAASITFKCDRPNARWHCRHRRSCAVHNILNIVRAGMYTDIHRKTVRKIQTQKMEKDTTHIWVPYNIHYIVLSHRCVCALFTGRTHTNTHAKK